MYIVIKQSDTFCGLSLAVHRAWVYRAAGRVWGSADHVIDEGGTRSVHLRGFNMADVSVNAKGGLGSAHAQILGQSVSSLLLGRML